MLHVEGACDFGWLGIQLPDPDRVGGIQRRHPPAAGIEDVDRDGALTGRLAFVYAAALLPITAALAWAGVTGAIYLVASQLLGLSFAALTV